jgi:hypothetical protein
LGHGSLAVAIVIAGLILYGVLTHLMSIGSLDHLVLAREN